MLFTPLRHDTLERIKMDVKETDIPRGCETEFFVEDNEGKIYRCTTEPCKFENCYCDAVIYMDETPKEGE